MRTTIFVLLLSMGSNGCGGESGSGDSDADVDSDSDTDVDSDVDTDTDSDSDSDSDTGTGLDPRETDADSDGISDFDEGVEGGTDTDGDGTPDTEDTDSDDDGLGDADEAGDAALDTPPRDTDADGTPDFRDRDSDGDSLGDEAETAAGTDPLLSDTDGDGSTDVVEVAVGTDALDPDDHLGVRGDLAFVAPSGGTIAPAAQRLEIVPRIRFVDVYLGVDSSGSMAAELDGLERSIVSAIEGATCEANAVPCARDYECVAGTVCGPGGLCVTDPLEAGCIPDLWTGLGRWWDLDTFTHLLAPQPDPASTEAAVPVAGAGTFDAPLQAPACAADGANCTNDPGCEGSGIGCVGFREDVRRIYLQYTDADDQCGSSPRCDLFTAAITGAALADVGIDFVGIFGSGDDGGDGTAQSVAQDLATAAGTLDAAGLPLVFDEPFGFGAAFETAAVAVALDLPFDAIIRATDDGDDGVDAAVFIEGLDAVVGVGGCEADTTADDDGDGVDDSFPDVVAGTTVCWDVRPRATNDVVAPDVEPRAYRARVATLGDDTMVDERFVYFVVPAEP